DRRRVRDDDDDLAGHEAAPRERPALLEPSDEGRERRGQDHMPVNDEAARSHDVADADEQRLDVVDAAQKAGRNRGSRPEDDDEDDRRLTLLEEEEREREPR